MFCYKCGYKLNDDAIFCQQCGTRLTPLHNTQIVNQEDKKEHELNHEALKIYLDNLLALEVINQKLNNRRRKINSNLAYMEVAVLGLDAFLISKHDSGDDYWCSAVCFGYDGKSFYLAMKQDNGEQTVDTLSGAWGYNVTPLNGWRTRFSPDSYVQIRKNFVRVDDNNIKSLVRFKYLDYSANRKWTKRVLEAYERYKQTGPEMYQKNLKKIEDLRQMQKEIMPEVTEAKRLLQNAYNTNIIPMEFRSIYAVYYLREFVNSSRESLTTALLHFNLNEIKKKLDTIIVQQQEIIIQQAIMISQNDSLMRQNQAQLERLAAIESNTSLAAQYSEIAANNAEACAWIGLANYIK